MSPAIDTVPAGHLAVQYTPGSWLALVRANHLLIIPGDTDTSMVHGLWALLAGAPGPERVLQELLRAHAMDLSRLCPFALATLDRTPRVLLRGGLGLRAGGASGDVTGNGADVGTWTERRLTDTHTLMLGSTRRMMQDTAAPTAPTADGNWWPLSEGIVLVDGIRVDLSDAATAPDSGTATVAAPVPEPAPEPGPAPGSVHAHPAADAAAEPAVAEPAAAPRAQESRGPETASFPVIVPGPADTADDEDTLLSVDHRSGLTEAPAAAAEPVRTPEPVSMADPDDQDTILGSALPRPRTATAPVTSAVPAPVAPDTATYRNPTMPAAPAPFVTAAPAAPDRIPGLIESTPWTGPKPAVSTGATPPAGTPLPARFPAPSPSPSQPPEFSSTLPPPALSSPATRPFPAIGDHDGETLLRGNLPDAAAAPASAPAPEATPERGTGPLVISRICAAGHANPPTATHCSRCAQPVGADIVQAPRPPLGHMLLADGARIELDRSVVIGRQPASPRASSASMPRMLQVKSPSGDISRSHVEVRLDGWHVLLVDLNATNGTRLMRPGQSPRRLGTGESVMLLAGDTADLGDGVSLYFGDLP